MAGFSLLWPRLSWIPQNNPLCTCLVGSLGEVARSWSCRIAAEGLHAVSVRFTLPPCLCVPGIVRDGAGRCSHLLGPWVVVGSHQDQHLLWNFFKEFCQEASVWGRNEKRGEGHLGERWLAILIFSSSPNDPGGPGWPDTELHLQRVRAPSFSWPGEGSGYWVFPEKFWAAAEVRAFGGLHPTP